MLRLAVLGVCVVFCLVRRHCCVLQRLFLFVHVLGSFEMEHGVVQRVKSTLTLLAGLCRKQPIDCEKTKIYAVNGKPDRYE